MAEHANHANVTMPFESMPMVYEKLEEIVISLIDASQVQEVYDCKEVLLAYEDEPIVEAIYVLDPN